MLEPSGTMFDPALWGSDRAPSAEPAGGPSTTEIVQQEPVVALEKGELGTMMRDSGLEAWKPQDWSESNRIVKDVPITVGILGTPGYRVIHGTRDANTPSDHGLPSSMITGRGRIALSGRECLGGNKPEARELTCPEVARRNYSKRHDTLHPHYSTQLPVDLDLAAARMFYDDRANSWGDRTLENGYGLGHQEALHHLDYVPRKDLIYPSAAATVLQANLPEYSRREELMLGSCVLPQKERQHIHEAHHVNLANELHGPAELANWRMAPHVESALRKEAQWDGYMAVCRTANVAPHSSI